MRNYFVAAFTKAAVITAIGLAAREYNKRHHKFT